MQLDSRLVGCKDADSTLETLATLLSELPPAIATKYVDLTDPVLPGLEPGFERNVEEQLDLANPAAALAEMDAAGLEKLGVASEHTASVLVALGEHDGTVVVVGSDESGKTSLLNALIGESDPKKNPFAQQDAACVDGALGKPLSKTHRTLVTNGPAGPVKLVFWDPSAQTAGSWEAFRMVAFKDIADKEPKPRVMLLIYDMTRQESLDSVNSSTNTGLQLDAGWAGDISQNCDNYKGILLVGAKQDLWDKAKPEARTSLQAGYQVAKEIGAKGFVCASAKTGFGLHAGGELLGSGNQGLKHQIVDLLHRTEDRSAIPTVHCESMEKPEKPPAEPAAPAPAASGAPSDSKPAPPESKPKDEGGGCCVVA